MFTLWSDIDRLFNRSFADWMLRDRAYKDGFGNLRMNLIDAGENLEFMAELPGVEEKDMELSVHNDTLTFGAKRTIAREKDQTIYLAERGDYDIRRSIALPARVEADKAVATLKNGILHVVLPKAPESKPKQISINA